MYILDRWTGDDDSLIYWKYINILQPRSKDIESGMFGEKKRNSKSRDEVYVKSRPSSLSLSLSTV